MKNVLKLLAKSVLIPLELAAAASATDAAIQNKIFGPGLTALLISNEKMDHIIIVKSLEESGLLMKGVSETIKNEVKEQRGGFLGMLFGALGSSLLGNILTGKGYKWSKSSKIPGRGIMRAAEVRAGERTIRAGKGFLMLPHPLTNFEIQKYYQEEPKLNGVY